MSAIAPGSVPFSHGLARSAGRASVPGGNRGHDGRAAGHARVPRPSAQPGYSGSGHGGATVYGGPDYGPPFGYGGGGTPGGPGGPGGPGLPGGPPRRGPRPRWGRIALVAGVAVLVLALLGAGGAWLYADNLNDDMKRTDAFAGITAGRPVKTVEGALNILLVGTDSRDPDAPMDKAGKWRADTIILMHVPSTHDKAYLVSIPRDLYVPIPQNAGAACDDARRSKINAAFAWGGLPLAVRTVECFSDVRIDHVMAIDFAGFKEVTDALGGVDLYVERNITSIHKPYRKFRKGLNHMNGAEALDWIRQRKQFPTGDFARMQHQQEFLKALMDKAASTGTLTSPAKLDAFLTSATAALTVDHGFSLLDMALQFRNLRGEDLRFVTSPHQGTDTIDGQSVVVSDRKKALAMYQAINSDTMAAWVQANAPATSKPGAN